MSRRREASAEQAERPMVQMRRIRVIDSNGPVQRTGGVTKIGTHFGFDGSGMFIPVFERESTQTKPKPMNAQGSVSFKGK